MRIDELPIPTLKVEDVVAFKTLKGEWFTGWIEFITPTSLRISLNVPIAPQWYSDEDQTIYYLHEVTSIVLLEEK